MQQIIRFGTVLAVISMAAAGLLAGVHALTEERIIAQAQAEEQASLKEVLAKAARFEPVKQEEQTLYYRAYDQQDKVIAVAFKAQGQGYSSVIETMAGMQPDGTITCIKILSQTETPGLGARISEREFTAQFAGKKDLSNVQAITGATISSKSVIEAVKKKAQEIKLLLENVPKNE